MVHLLRTGIVISVLFLLLVTTADLQAQVVEEWVAIYNGAVNAEDAATDVATDAAGNVYVTGYTATLPLSPWNFDYCTIKYDTTGAVVWSATYNGPISGADLAQAIYVDAGDNVYVTGYSEGLIAGGPVTLDYATVKYDANGIQMWAVRYNGTGNLDDVANDITVDMTGNVYVTGLSWNQMAEDYATVKYDPTGAQLWVARYDGPGMSSDEAQTVAVNQNFEVFVTGWSLGLGTSFDYATIAYDPMGIQLWVNRYNGPANSGDGATDLVLDENSNVYVTGWSQGPGTQEDFATIAYNVTGGTIWTNRWNNVGYEDVGNAIEVDHDGNVYVTGYTSYAPYPMENFDYATIQYSATGAQNWVNIFDGPMSAEDKAQDIEVDDYGNSYVTGWATAQDSSKDYCTLKYDFSGGQQWVMFYNDPLNGDDLAQAISLSPEGKVHVTGWIYGFAAASLDWATVRYSPTVMVWLDPISPPIQIPASGG
ncbi:SBBP repeat-containing protein, partial [bacterium]|nr:SBBP repeat-containing protein [bacterium]